MFRKSPAGAVGRHGDRSYSHLHTVDHHKSNMLALRKPCSRVTQDGDAFAGEAPGISTRRAKRIHGILLSTGIDTSQVVFHESVDTGSMYGRAEIALARDREQSTLDPNAPPPPSPGERPQAYPEPDPTTPANPSALFKELLDPVAEVPSNSQEPEEEAVKPTDGAQAYF